MKLVVHCKTDKFDVYIGRPSIWGNPYSHKDGTLAKYKTKTVQEALDKYREYLTPEMKDRARKELKGKVLGCWCKTKKNPDAPCHGDILVEVANSERETP